MIDHRISRTLQAAVVSLGILVFPLYSQLAVAGAAADFLAELQNAVQLRQPVIGYSAGWPGQSDSIRGREYLEISREFGIPISFVGVACCDNRNGSWMSINEWEIALKKIQESKGVSFRVLEVYFPVTMPGLKDGSAPRCKGERAPGDDLLGPDGELSPAARSLIQKMSARIEIAAQHADVVLVRPFHEANGEWFWWGDARLSARLYKKLWSELQAAIPVPVRSSLLWVYAVDASGSLDRAKLMLPDQVDVIGVDYYGGLGSPGARNAKRLTDIYAWAVSTSHPVGFSELGGWASPVKRQCIDWVRAFEYQKKYLPAISYIQVWGGPYGMTFHSDPALLTKWLGNGGMQQTGPAKKAAWVDQCRSGVPVPAFPRPACLGYE